MLSLAVRECRSLTHFQPQVCVSRWDWETFPENFALSRQADEKALYRYLKAEVAPLIIPGLIVRPFSPL
jgi:hypothetical protein